MSAFVVHQEVATQWHQNLIADHLPQLQLDFQENIYGKRIEVEFKHKIRDEQKFTTMDSLVENIRRDVNDIRTWFSQIKNTENKT